MSHTPPTAASFPRIFEDALEAYEKQTKNDLVAHPLAAQLQECDSPAAILEVLKQKVREFTHSSTTYERWGKWLDPTVNILYALSATLGEGVGLVFSPGKVIFVGIGVLLLAAKDVRTSQGALIDIFERIENFIRRLEVYTKVPMTTEMRDITMKVMVEVLSILAILTKEIKRGRIEKYVVKLMGRTDLEDALKRVDTLTQEEARMAIAQALMAMHTVNEGVRNLAIRMTVIDVEQVQRNQLRESMYKWLSPPDPSTNHNIACDTHHKTMATWFFEESIFREWMLRGSLLWIHGKPGSGKSVLCSTIIQDVPAMCDPGQTLMAYFYFDFRDPKKQNCGDLVLSFLTQLSARSASCCDILSRLYADYDNGMQQPSNDDLAQCLKEMLMVSGRHQIYLIIDALDESPNTFGIPSPRERVLDLLKDFLKLHLLNLRICVTSRLEIDIRNVIEPLTPLLVSLHDQCGQKKDIVDYIRSVVYSDSETIMRRWRKEDKELVIKTLSERADGMYRWVVCQLETLRHCLPSSVRRTLNELPESLDETYKRILEEIKRPNREYVLRLLQCLVVASRPLHVTELSEIFAVDFGDAGNPTLNPSWRCEDHEQALLSSCSSLITIVDCDHGDDQKEVWYDDKWYDYKDNSKDNDHDRDSRVRVVQFSHISVKEFLTSARLASWSGDIAHYRVVLEAAHTTLARACLGVLLQLDDPFHKNDALDRSPLARYAAQYWVCHAQRGDASSQPREALECLFDQNRPHYVVWLKLYDIDTRPPDRSMFYLFNANKQSTATPLYYAALCGFRDLAGHLVTKYPEHVNTDGGYYVRPLMAALAGYHFQTAELLLSKGADLNLHGMGYRTPLHSAVYNGTAEEVQRLLKYGADPNSRDDTGGTALYYASRCIHLRDFNVVRVLLKHDRVDVNVRANDRSTPLHKASWSGHLEITRLLLENKADVEAEDGWGMTPIQIASERRHSKIIKLLLDYGAS